MHSYTVRHAMCLTLIVGIGVSLWTAFCFVLGLPFHPWLTTAIGVFVGTSLFFFAGLDPVGVRILHRLFDLWSLLLLVCVALAAVFGAQGGPFPLWALIPVLILGGVFGGAVVFFGIRSILRVLIGHPDQRLEPEDDFDGQ